MKTAFFLLFLGLLMGGFAQAQSPDALDSYVRQGLERNIVVQQKSISLEMALLSLKMANGMFAPSVSLLGNFTSGEGGRSISFPIGDIMNPVYTTLNQLTASDQFPRMENVNTNFFPRNFYDVRARTSMPLLNTDLIYNKKIRGQQVLLQEYEVQVYQRELVRNIKVAYFNYLSAREGVVIYQSALTRAQEGKRVNEALLANGKGLPAYVLRSQAEIENIKAQLVDAERQVENGRLYFNFLLNREGTEEINTDFVPELSTVTTLLAEDAVPTQREELLQIKTAQELNQQVLKMNKLFWAPRVSGFVDLGAQAENMEYSSKANYYLYGFQLEMPLFSGFTNRHRISQSRLDVRNAELNVDQVNRQLRLSTEVSRNALVSAFQNYQSALKQLEAAQSYQRLIEKGYKEGVNTFIEAVDARNQLTSAELLVRVNLYRVLVAEASLEREMASYPLN
ncbi:MAG: TolC family protein [Cyclobacteriaceae bacterium]|jgi:outer membrane protein|nr:TolC family protein [Flammeovirgaceae bacterium]